MDSLSEDLLPELLSALGNSTHSYATGVRTSAVNTVLRELGARLPCVDQASCEMNVDQLIHVFKMTKEFSWDVYDVRDRRIVRVTCNSHLLKFTFPNKPSPGSRWLEVERRLIWSKPWNGSSSVRLSVADVDLHRDKEELDRLVKLPLEDLKLSRQDCVTISAPEIQTLTSRRAKAPSILGEGAVQLAIDQIARNLTKPINREIKQLSLCNSFSHIEQEFRVSNAAHLVAARLTHLKLIHLRLSSAEVTRITLAADRLHLLDLSHSAELDSTSCRDLGLLMQRWRAAPDETDIRRLVLDGLDGISSEIHLTTLIYGASMPGMEAWDTVDNSSQITQGTPKMYLSCDACQPRHWADAIQDAYARPAELAYPNVKLLTAAASPAAVVVAQPQRKKQRIQQPSLTAAASMQSVLRMAAEHAQLPPAYTDAVRERDRYMMQWFDYKCANCGTVWTKNSVTISYRQTAVSECLKGKRGCTSRAECTRMLSGEKFITIKHMAGNGGSDLTPSSAIIKAAEEHGLLVAIDPELVQPQFFKPHPTKPPPAKIPARPDAVPESLLNDD